MKFQNICPQEIDTNVSIGVSQETVVPNGFYKIKIVQAGDEKVTSTGDKKGQFFTFQIDEGPHAGKKFSRWFCTEITKSSDLWQKELSEKFFTRIAQTIKIERLQSENQLLEIPFIAKLTQRESVLKPKKEIDLATGEEVPSDEKPRTIVQMDFIGNLNEIILSCEKYAKKGQRNTVQEEKPKAKILKKKTPPPEVFEDDENDEEESGFF